MYKRYSLSSKYRVCRVHFTQMTITDPCIIVRSSTSSPGFIRMTYNNVSILYLICICIMYLHLALAVFPFCICCVCKAVLQYFIAWFYSTELRLCFHPGPINHFHSLYHCMQCLRFSTIIVS